MKSDNVFKIAVVALLVFIAYQVWWGNKSKDISYAGNAGQFALTAPQPVIVRNETSAPFDKIYLLKLLGAVATILSILWKMVGTYLGN